MKVHTILRKSLCLLLAILMVTAVALPAAAAEVTFTTLISPKYEDAKIFSDDLAAVKQNGKWGYIDKTGKTVIPFQFDKAYPFSEGLAIVGKIEQRDGYHWTGELDEWGNWVMEDGTGDVYVWYLLDTDNHLTALKAPQYVWDPASGETRRETLPVYGFCKEVDAVSHDPIYYNGYINLNKYSNYFNDDGYTYNAVFDRDGQALDVGDYVIKGVLAEGLFSAYIPYMSGLYFLDEEGNVVLDLSMLDASNGISFNQGLSPVWFYSYTEDGMSQGAFGFINKSGQTVIAPQFSGYYYMSPTTACVLFNDGIASMGKGGDESGNGALWGGIDKTGKTVIPFVYDHLNSFLEGLAVAERGGKYGVIDTANNVVIPFEYDRLSGFSNGLCVAVKDGRAFCIDRYGKEIPGSDTVDADIYFPGGLDSNEILTPGEVIVVQENGKYGYMEMTYTADLPQPSEMDSWAYEEIIAAIEADLIPNSMQNQYRTNITRADFAALAVELITTATGKTAEELVQEATGQTMTELVATYPFIDANDESILAAHALGIINGKGNGVFDPYGLLTRQDAATMLMRAGEYLGITDPEGEAATFSDSAAIADYAREAVEYVNVLGVMNGTSDTTFTPRGNYTRQQAYLTFYRLYEARV